MPTLNDRSCVAVSVDGEPVASKNADLAVIPASTQKLLVAAVALDQLGDSFTFSTGALGGERAGRRHRSTATCTSSAGATRCSAPTGIRRRTWSATR